MTENISCEQAVESCSSVKEQIKKPKILVVDDEAGIRKSLQGAFSDEGYLVVLSESADRALAELSEIKPDLVFLDIWMPGMDGLEALAEIKKRHANLPVIVMSGHANISIAVKATKQGAFDFVEKPLDLSRVLELIKRALGAEVSHHSSLIEANDVSGNVDRGSLNMIVANSTQFVKGRVFKQKTLASSAGLFGQGLHSGNKSGIMLEPLPEGSGIHFVGIQVNDIVPAHVDFVESTGYATTLRLGGTEVGTIEHLMSALNAYGVTNLLIKCNGEIPVMDGSAAEFCSLLEKTGIVEQAAELNAIALSEPVRIGNETEYILAEPSDRFIIDYTLKYPAPLGIQNFVFELGDIETYRREIAPARTFGFVKDVGWLQRQGLAQGGRFDNFVLFGDSGPINCELRFKDEPVRHKVLDAIGDLYLLGRPLQAKVSACMTGHSDNVALLRALLRKAGE